MNNLLDLLGHIVLTSSHFCNTTPILLKMVLFFYQMSSYIYSLSLILFSGFISMHVYICFCYCTQPVVGNELFRNYEYQALSLFLANTWQSDWLLTLGTYVVLYFVIKLCSTQTQVVLFFRTLCYIIAEGYFFILSFFIWYILPFGLIRLRTFRLSSWVSYVHTLSAGVHAHAGRMWQSQMSQ